MRINITKGDIIWSYAGYILRFCSNLLILPMVLRILPEKDLGIWYVFSSIGALVFLLDFGFSPTIMRNITYGWAGATDIKREGVSELSAVDAGPCYSLVYKIILVSKRIYLFISIAALVLMSSIGTYYIYSLSHDLKNFDMIMTAWFIYCAGTFINLCYFYWIPVLSGIGLIKEGQKATVASQLVYIGITYLGLLLGYGIISMSIAYTIIGVIFRAMSRYYFYREKGVKENISILRETTRLIEYRDVFRKMWYNTYKLGIVIFGTYLVQQSNTIICSLFLGLEVTASYGLSLQLFTAVSGFSMILFRSYLPLFNEARVKNDVKNLKRFFSISVVASWVSYISGGIFIVLFGNMAMKLMGSATSLLSPQILMFMLLYLFLEFNHGSIFSTFITTKNEVPFIGPSLVSGIVIVALSITLVSLTGLGLKALLLSQCLVQLVYNNWKWPYIVLKEMKMSVAELVSTGCSNIYLMFTKARNA